MSVNANEVCEKMLSDNADATASYPDDEGG